MMSRGIMDGYLLAILLKQYPSSWERFVFLYIHDITIIMTGVTRAMQRPPGIKTGNLADGACIPFQRRNLKIIILALPLSYF